MSSGTKPISRPAGGVYLDHTATTPCLPEVVQAMLPYFSDRFYNAQSNYPGGEESLTAVEEARQQVADMIGASPHEVYFTSGATESNNWTLKGMVAMPRGKGRHIVTSAIEHFSVLHPCRTLQKQGFEVTYLRVDSDGFVDPQEVRRALRPDTVLVSVTHASNEIGTLEPAAEIGAVCREAGVRFHLDAANTAGVVPVNVGDLRVDLMTVSPQMFYGPKGVGALYVRRGLRLPPLMEGGTQEGGRRPGTENVPAIVGTGVACAAAARDMERRVALTAALRDRLFEGLDRMSRVRITGHRSRRLPNHVSCLVDQIKGEGVLLSLAMDSDIQSASGSACGAKALQHSYVLEAIGVDAALGLGSLVFGIGIGNTEQQIDYLLQELPPVVDRLRAMSPFG